MNNQKDVGFRCTLPDLPSCAMKDPIVEEVRKYRMEHTRRFKGELSAICADLRTIQTASGHKVVRLAPRKLDMKKTSSLRGETPR